MSCNSQAPVIMFRQRILTRMDYPCPAVQDAIDRIAAASCNRHGDEGRNRQRLSEWLDWEVIHADSFCARFFSDLLTAYKESDVILATGLTVDDLNEVSKVRS